MATATLLSSSRTYRASQSRPGQPRPQAYHCHPSFTTLSAMLHLRISRLTRLYFRCRRTRSRTQLYSYHDPIPLSLIFVGLRDASL